MNIMDQFCLFINSEDSLSTFANNVGGNFKVRLPKRYTLDGSWECALLEVSFIPELEASTRRMYFCSDFVHQSCYPAAAATSATASTASAATAAAAAGGFRV
ncbi:Hypothetical predicted protein [Mytilus galloprovincialis]|uniref:Uncharacterized protein n=1 Tax=Mytilus galloprovincialis TaxID=29158 RepID=A0A8B6E5N6_MYTGA|nr:Hypothetical predicted protein [Mytilus galloprovincialis]